MCGQVTEIPQGEDGLRFLTNGLGAAEWRAKVARMLKQMAMCGLDPYTNLESAKEMFERDWKIYAEAKVDDR